MRWLIACFFSLSIVDASAQENNRTCKKFIDSIIIDSNQLIVFESIKLRPIIEHEVKITPLNNNRFLIELDDVIQDSVEVCFHVLPSVFSTIFKSDTKRYYDSTALFTNIKGNSENSGYADKRQELFEMGELNRSGKISRGIATGNTQNLSVNSSLFLNLEGKLSEDLNIKAHISDQDIPYQPEGNTQQLQDFDKVFVQLYNDKFSVIGGDVVLENGNSRFLKYKKNVLGGMIDYATPLSKTSIGASSAKGQFAAVTVEIQDGVYGPYKIPPPDNLGYVIIIANSEKVYLDGKQLIRGYENDYVIDYNQAEIEFTTNVLMTKYTRITVDFEYAITSYARSIITASHIQKIGTTSLRVNFYQEKDNKNKSLLRTLSDDDKRILSDAGDSLELAVVPGESLVEYDEHRILYIKMDTLVNGIQEPIFSRTLDNLPELYLVQFSDVGSGKGSYQIAEYVSAGRVYEWVGIGNGAFVPVVLLTPPNKKQMVSVSGDTKLSEYASVYFEAAFSQLNKNLFSELQSEDDKGQAFMVGTNIKKLPFGNSEYSLSSSLETEFLTKNFSIIDRFRRVEFDRDWGISGEKNKLGEQDVSLSASVGLEKDGFNNFSYKINYRTKEHVVSGFQHQLNASKTLGFLQFKTDAFLMNGIMPSATSNWLKFNGEAFVRGKIQPGYRYTLGQNSVKDITSDSVISSKNYFEDHQFFVRGDFIGSTKFELLYSNRYDKLPQSGEFKNASKAETVTGKLSSQINSNHTINVVVNYRMLTNYLKAAPVVPGISGRIDWTGNIIPNTIKNELSYTIANARVPKREYVFIEVPLGEGTHTWRDDNGNNTKELDEFFEAFNYDEKTYIKLYVPSNKFVDAFENKFNYRLILGFPLKWQKMSGFKKAISNFSNTTSLTTQYSTTEDNFGARLIPFIVDLDSTRLLLARQSFRSTIFLNRNNPKFGINVGYLSRGRKILYANGFERRQDEEYTLVLRWNLKRQYQFDVKVLFADRNSNSDYLIGRNYSLEESKIGPLFAWQPRPTLRLSTTYNYGFSQQLNVTELVDNNKAVLNELTTELRLGSATKYMFNITAKYTAIEFEGEEKSPVGYELLKGLKPGGNYSFLLNWQQRLINGLQIQLFYEGRKPEGVAIIHSVRASIGALF